MAAVTNYLSTAGPMTDKTFADMVDRAIQQMVKTVEAVATEGEQYFDLMPTSLKSFKVSDATNIVDLPQENEDADNIPVVAPPPGFPKTFTTVNYRSGIWITRDMKENDLHQVVGILVSGLPNSAKQRREYLYADFLNDAFSGSTYTGADGVSMFNNSHPHRDPGASTNTWDNLASAGLPSQSGLTAMWQLGQAITNDKGFPSPVNVTRFVTSPTQWPTLKRLLASTQEAENSLNAENIWKGQFTLDQPYHYLTLTTAWMGYGQRGGTFKGLVRVVRQKDSYEPMSKSDNPDIIMGKRVRFSMTVGVLSGKSWLGNAGA
jgi:hypothetical protein